VIWGVARAVIVGGGIIGTSVAYHLAKLGLRSSSNLTRLIRYSAELYERLEAGTGQATGWKRCGSLSVARTAEPMVQVERNAALVRSSGVSTRGISRARVSRSRSPAADSPPAAASWPRTTPMASE
jgi:glycine/D-amino acid oxidase-like deaminating enzyme